MKIPIPTVIPSRLTACAFAFWLAFNLPAVAQCDKDLILTSSKTEYLDANGLIQRSVEEKSTVRVGRKEVVIVPGNSDRKVTATVTSTSCEWKVPFKTGKTSLEIQFVNVDGITRNATLTIEGKDGKVTVLMEPKDTPNRKIRVPIDTFAEQE